MSEAVVCACKACVFYPVSPSPFPPPHFSTYSFRRRMLLYRTMLTCMPEEQKLTIVARLTQDVLTAVVDGSLPLDPAAYSADLLTQFGRPFTPGSTEDLVCEAFDILSCPVCDGMAWL